MQAKQLNQILLANLYFQNYDILNLRLREPKAPKNKETQKQPPYVFLKISQNFQGNNCTRVFFFNKVVDRSQLY